MKPAWVAPGDKPPLGSGGRPGYAVSGGVLPLFLCSWPPPCDAAGLSRSGAREGRDAAHLRPSARGGDSSVDGSLQVGDGCTYNSLFPNPPVRHPSDPLEVCDGVVGFSIWR